MAGAAMQPATQTTEYGGFGQRFLALLIDGVILFVACLVIRIPLRMTFGAILAGLIMIPIQMLAGIAYEAYFLSSPKQATIGKQAMGLIVTDINGAPIDMGKAALRAVGKIISGLILLLGYIMAAFTERKQALHDIIAGTLVLKGKR